MKIGQRLKDLRKRHGFTQVELANKIEVSESTISRYERDEIEPTITTAYRMAIAFGCSIDYLVKEVEDVALKDSSEIKEMIAIIQDLSNEDFKAVRTVIAAFQAKSILS